MADLSWQAILDRPNEELWGSIPCRIWQGAKTPDGYGVKRWEGRNQYVHRLVFMFVHKRWPTPFGCHHCDTPSCWEPAHIFEGTPKANTQDSLQKGRHSPGTPESCAKARAARAFKNGYANGRS